MWELKTTTSLLVGGGGGGGGGGTCLLQFALFLQAIKSLKLVMNGT